MTATVPPPARANARNPDADVASMFVDRWSRRALSPRALAPEVVRTLFEAARWAPSASNTQPWLFVYADDDESLARARPVLVDQNRRWADKAPLLLFVFAQKRLPASGAVLRTAAFDTGSAWMSLALQAHALGLVAHAMAGVHLEAAHQVFSVPADEFEAICAIAVGYPGDADELPEDLRAREHPSTRKPALEFAHKGRYRG
jgi:nitroreductase